MLTGKVCSYISWIKRCAKWVKPPGSKERVLVVELLEPFPISTSAQEMTWYVKLITDILLFFFPRRQTVVFLLLFNGDGDGNSDRITDDEWRSGILKFYAVYLFSIRLGIHHNRLTRKTKIQMICRFYVWSLQVAVMFIIWKWNRWLSLWFSISHHLNLGYPFWVLATNFREYWN